MLVSNKRNGARRVLAAYQSTYFFIVEPFSATIQFQYQTSVLACALYHVTSCTVSSFPESVLLSRLIGRLETCSIA